MLRRVLPLAAALLLVAVAALATSARVRALGGQSDFFEDDVAVQRWYGALIDYPDAAYLEAGDWNHDTGDLDGTAGGLHFQFDAAGTWGTAAMYFGDDLPEPDPGGWFRLLYGRRFGGLALAATFRGTSYSQATSEPPDHALQGTSRFLHDLGLGARWDLGDLLYADVAAEIREGEIDYYDNENGITVEDDGGFHSWGARARVFHGIDERAAVVYRLEWYRDRRPVTDAVMDGLVDLDRETFRAGLGFDILVDPDNLLLASVDYDRREEDRDAVHPFYATWEHGWRDWWRLEVRVGVESRLLPWLTLRAAASYRRTVDESLYSYTWAPDFEERLYDYDLGVETPVVLGLGLHYGNVDADLVINDKALFDPTTGAARRDTGAGDTYTSLTLRYGF
jgi:hypothetical protein